MFVFFFVKCTTACPSRAHFLTNSRDQSSRDLPVYFHWSPPNEPNLAAHWNYYKLHDRPGISIHTAVRPYPISLQGFLFSVCFPSFARGHNSSYNEPKTVHALRIFHINLFRVIKTHSSERERGFGKNNHLKYLHTTDSERQKHSYSYAPSYALLAIECEKKDRNAAVGITECQVSLSAISSNCFAFCFRDCFSWMIGGLSNGAWAV